MSLRIKSGTIVHHDRSEMADIYCHTGIIRKVGLDLDIPAATEIIDAHGCLVMPGGIDPHTHMQLPFMVPLPVRIFTPVSVPPWPVAPP